MSSQWQQVVNILHIYISDFKADRDVSSDWHSAEANTFMQQAVLLCEVTLSFSPLQARIYVGGSSIASAEPYLDSNTEIIKAMQM